MPAEEQANKHRNDDVQEDTKQLVIKIEEASLLALRQEEEEEDLDADADLDDDDIESELDDGTFPWQGEKVSTPRTPKRTLEEIAEPTDNALDGDQEDVEREGTPPKRARLADAEPEPRQLVTSSPVSMRKRSSEELEDGAIAVQSGKRVKA